MDDIVLVQTDDPNSGLTDNTAHDIFKIYDANNFGCESPLVLYSTPDRVHSHVLTSSQLNCLSTCFKVNFRTNSSIIRLPWPSSHIYRVASCP